MCRGRRLFETFVGVTMWSNVVEGLDGDAEREDEALAGGSEDELGDAEPPLACFKGEGLARRKLMVVQDQELKNGDQFMGTWIRGTAYWKTVVPNRRKVTTALYGQSERSMKCIAKV